jgi:tetratricopeptide (TPR) repeat protein
MVMRISPVVLASAAALASVVEPPACQAQPTPFMSAVRELAELSLESSAGAPAPLETGRTAPVERLRAALDDWDRALSELEARLAREQDAADVTRRFQRHVELGLAYQQRGRWDAAVRQFDAAANLRRDASDIHLLRALTLEAAGRDAEAGAAFRTAWARDAASPVKAYLVLRRAAGIPAAERERAQRVVRETYRRLLSDGNRTAGAPLFPTIDPVPDTLARAPVVGDEALAALFGLLAEGRLDEARAVLDASITSVSERESPLARFRRARADEAEGRLSEARQGYAAALKGALAGRHRLYVGIGRLAQVEGELEAAVAAFEQAVRLNPNEPALRRELAAACAAAGRTDDAFIELVAALLIDPRDAEALAAIGQLFLDMDRPSDAIPALTRALEVRPDRFATRYLLALALLGAGRTEEAAREFDRFERLNGQALERRRLEVQGGAEPAGAER